jgi:hypothetical protein
VTEDVSDADSVYDRPAVPDDALSRVLGVETLDRCASGRVR